MSTKDSTPRRRLDLSAPLSRALIPLSLGLKRRALLRAGARSEQRRLAGILTHAYALDGRRGSDPALPVVLIHGIADSALTWSLVLRPLAAIGPLYALDMPGHGQSGHPPGRRYATIAEQAAVLAAFVREVVGRPALLVGNSMGGWVAARVALDAPELVRGLALLAPGGALLGGRGSWEGFARTVAVPDLRAVRAIYRQMFGRVPPGLYLAQHGFRDLFAREGVQAFVDAALAAAEAEDLAATGLFVADDLRRITAPTTIVWGACDTFLPAGTFEFFCENMPAAEVHTLAGCGHLPQQEAAKATARIVRAFAAGLPGR